MNVSCITIIVLMNNMIWYSFLILLINLTIDFIIIIIIIISESNYLFKLSKLTDLNLRDNYFDNKILWSFGALLILKSLDLSFNNMWSLSSQSTCILKFFLLNNTMKKFRQLKSYNQYLPLSTFSLFGFKSTKCFRAIPKAFDICKW